MPRGWMLLLLALLAGTVSIIASWQRELHNAGYVLGEVALSGLFGVAVWVGYVLGRTPIRERKREAKSTVDPTKPVPAPDGYMWAIAPSGLMSDNPLTLHLYDLKLGTIAYNEQSGLMEHERPGGLRQVARPVGRAPFAKPSQIRKASIRVLEEIELGRIANRTVADLNQHLND